MVLVVWDELIVVDKEVVVADETVVDDCVETDVAVVEVLVVDTSNEDEVVRFTVSSYKSRTALPPQICVLFKSQGNVHPVDRTLPAFN